MIEVSEYNTSKQCSRCGSMRTETVTTINAINADENGAENKRAIAHGRCFRDPARSAMHTPQPHPSDAIGHRKISD